MSEAVWTLRALYAHEFTKTKKKDKNFLLLTSIELLSTSPHASLGLSLKSIYDKIPRKQLTFSSAVPRSNH